MQDKPSLINCHTHIFTGDFVPPFLAKTFLPWPFYYFIPLSLVVELCRFWYKVPFRWQFKPWYKWIKEKIYKMRMFGSRTGLSRMLSFLVGLILGIHVFYILNDWISEIGVEQSKTGEVIHILRSWLNNYFLLYIPTSLTVKIALILIFVIFFKTGRNFIFLLLKKVWSFIGLLPGAKTKELFNRYLNIARFALHGSQKEVFQRLKSQYPQDTGFVILPMDMEFMEAGNLKKNWLYVEKDGSCLTLSK